MDGWTICEIKVGKSHDIICIAWELTLSFPLCYSKEQRRKGGFVGPGSICPLPLLSGDLVGAGEGGEAESAGCLYSF